jgi:holdfast attachment protein HfaA
MRGSNTFIGLLAGAVGACLCPAMAQAGDFSNAATYNTPIDTNPGQDNQPASPSLRDANGNLTLVNGQFTSSASAKAFAQSSATAFASGGVGTGGSGVAFGGASAIGNSLNVVTVGNNNTVIVDSQQKNTGDITATVTVNGKH